MNKEAGYVGLKFPFIKLSSDLPNDQRLRELTRWCKIFHYAGLAPPYSGGSYGNLSFRLERGKPAFVITASNSGLADSTSPNRFVTVEEVDLDREIIFGRGGRKPSSESPVHAAIYYARPDVQVILHGHSDKISKRAIESEEKRKRSMETFKIPITEGWEEYGTIKLVRSVEQSLDGNMFLEMRNHGFLSMGKTLQEAGNRALHYLDRCR